MPNSADLETVQDIIGSPGRLPETELRRIYERFRAHFASELGGRYHVALTKIDAIRNSIIGRQGIHWSDHIYPLVAALNEAGFEGKSYEIMRPIEVDGIAMAVRERDAALGKLRSLTQRVANLKMALGDGAGWFDRAMSAERERDAARAEVERLRQELEIARAPHLKSEGRRGED